MRLINWRRVLQSLSLLLVFVVACRASDQHKTMHVLHGTAPEEVFCTAYAVGKHTFVTAKHCSNQTVYNIDDTPVTFDQIIDDNNDHIFVVESGVTFKDYIKFEVAKPVLEEKVHTFGNPLDVGIYDQYREGYVSGISKQPQFEGKDVYIFVMDVIPGDSGSVIFNKRGKTVGIVSRTNSGFVLSWPITFTKEQLKEIK